ncbi:unnamed protein product [Rotaria sordida]|uniref:t-SNARE coiled-coil homology domain-containing protein n=1 Tax=Rotaria sordida TaxID=392033 RepID=A0A813XDZ1_9BILA|nr:unnamed protein product [Rotaria sordida]CAF3630070.1 unnamed protein product [Rotaria sordida]
MFNNLINYCFPSTDILNDDEQSTVTTIHPIVLSDTRIEIECKEFLPEVYDTWSLIHKLSTNTINFREIYNLYKYERSENQQRDYFDQLKILDDTIYKLSYTIHQRIQSLEKFIQPILNEYQQNRFKEQQSNNYIPAYIRIAENQLNSLKLSFKRIIIKHNLNSIDYQNDLKQSIENSKTIKQSYEQISQTTINKIKKFLNTDEENLNITSIASQEQIQLQILEDKQQQQQQQDLTKQEIQIADLEARLESIRILKDRVRQMNEMTMALYLSVQEQNDLTDNIWLNTSTGSDYIAQSVDEFRLVKKLKQSKISLWIKLICITFCFLLILLLILTLILILNQK